MKKSRHEYKFQINEKDIVLLQARIGGVMKKDSHVGDNGCYHIRSVYFDDFADTCYYQNEAGTDPRAKYRIRIYNASDEKIKLEKKVKHVRLFRISVKRKDAKLFGAFDQRAGRSACRGKRAPDGQRGL